VESATLVYDSFPGAGGGGYGSSVSRYYGQRVDLAGDARFVTRLEVFLKYFGDGISSASQVRLSLYDATSLASFPEPPGELLGQGLGETISYGPSPHGCCGSAIIGAKLEGVQVPDTVVWTLEPVTEEPDYVISAVGLPTTTVSEANIGNSREIVRIDGGAWSTLRDPSTLTARMFAVVPEQSSALLAIVVGWVVIIHAGRRISQ
jgi:hypothetical protein